VTKHVLITNTRVLQSKVRIRRAEPFLICL